MLNVKSSLVSILKINFSLELDSSGIRILEEDHVTNLKNN